MNEKLNNLSKEFEDKFEDKYNKMINYFEERNKVINKKFEEIINYNKKMNEKFENLKKEEQNKLSQNQNEIKQLKEQLSISNNQLNEYKNIIKEKELQEENNKKKFDDLIKEIEQLKELNKKLKEEKKENPNNEKEINNENIENNEMIQQLNKYYNLINTNMVLIKKEKIKLIGLKNIGQKPFINSFLQCLFQIQPLINYFKNEKNINNNFKLASSFKELIIEMSNINEGSLSPEKIIKTFKEINNETKEDIIKFDNIYIFINSVMNKLHEELKVQDNNNINIIKNKLNKIEFESYKKAIKNEKSIISDLFQGIHQEVIKCNSKNLFFADNSIYNFNPFLFLSFDLNKLKLKKNTINIFDCFVNRRQEQIYSKIQFCEFCQKDCFMSFQSKILLCPKYLIIELKYDNDNENINNNYIKIDFEERLNITNFTKLENDKNAMNIYYNINGIITKVKNIFEVKYIAYYKNNDNNNWYRFDDEEIKLIIGNIKNDINNFEIPLILFYQIE